MEVGQTLDEAGFHRRAVAATEEVADLGNTQRWNQ